MRKERGEGWRASKIGESFELSPTDTSVSALSREHAKHKACTREKWEGNWIQLTHRGRRQRKYISPTYNNFSVQVGETGSISGEYLRRVSPGSVSVADEALNGLKGQRREGRLNHGRHSRSSQNSLVSRWANFFNKSCGGEQKKK